MSVIFCHGNIKWTDELLREVRPTVEELYLQFPLADHVRQVQSMPRLWKLSIRCDRQCKPIAMPALPGHHKGLRWLSVWRLPLITLCSLLSEHRSTLKTLWLFVGTPSRDTNRTPGRWPYDCPDIHRILDRCRLRALKKLVLVRKTESFIRHSNIFHDESTCTQQLNSVRNVMDREVEVLCSFCDQLELEMF